MSKVFGGIFVILSGDLLQLPPDQQQEIFMKLFLDPLLKHKNREYQVFQCLLWKYVFHL